MGTSKSGTGKTVKSATVKATKSRPVLKTAMNSLRVLQLFSDEWPELGVTEISKSLGLAKSTVSRILTTLVEESILDKDILSGKYRLGPLLLELGLVVSELNPIIRHSEPFLQSLRDSTQESSYLLLLDGYDSVCVASYESTSGAQIRKGIRSPLGTTVGGLTILASLESDAITPAMDHAALKSHLPAQQVDQIESILEDIHATGYGFHQEPRSTGLVTVACPVFTPRGAVTAAVAISGPLQRFTPQRQTSMVQALSKAAQQISRKLLT